MSLLRIESWSVLHLNTTSDEIMKYPMDKKSHEGRKGLKFIPQFILLLHLGSWYINSLCSLPRFIQKYVHESNVSAQPFTQNGKVPALTITQQQKVEISCYFQLIYDSSVFIVALLPVGEFCELTPAYEYHESNSQSFESINGTTPFHFHHDTS